MADIDHFKRVNDTFRPPGRRSVAPGSRQSLCRAVPRDRLPARYGGEEFAIIGSPDTAENTRNLAERCRKEIEKIAIPVHNRH